MINGKQAMMAIADFGDDRPYVEYLTWIYTERTHTFFYAMTEAQDFDAVPAAVRAPLAVHEHSVVHDR